MRRAGAVSIMLGGAGMITGPEYFWVAVALVNLGLILFTLDVFLEGWAKSWIRWVFVGLIVMILCAFNWFWVLSEAPLLVTAMAINAEYPQGMTIAGITWQDKFTRLDVAIENPSTHAYEDLNLVIKPNFHIAKITQATSYSGVTFEDQYGMDVRMVGVHGDQRAANPLELIATDAGYRVRCERLPAKSVLKIVMAIVDVRYDPHPNKPGELFSKDDLLRIKMDDGSTYYYGYPGVDHYTPRISVGQVKASGNYIAGQRNRAIDRKIVLGRR